MGAESRHERVTVAALHDLALLVHTFGTEEAQCSVLCRMSCPVNELRAEVCAAIVDFAEARSLRGTDPLLSWGLNRSSRMTLGHDIIVTPPTELVVAPFHVTVMIVAKQNACTFSQGNRAGLLDPADHAY